VKDPAKLPRIARIFADEKERFAEHEKTKTSAYIRVIRGFRPWRSADG
jgi:hypothetical protein